jgi:hypothetical protein
MNFTVEFEDFESELSLVRKIRMHRKQACHRFYPLSRGIAFLQKGKAIYKIENKNKK